MATATVTIQNRVNLEIQLFSNFERVHPTIEQNILALRQLCVKHQVESFAMFGSAARQTDSMSSDFDFLVRFSKSIELIDYSDNYFALHTALKSILKRNVDLVSEKSVKNPILKKEIERSKIVLF